MANCPKCQTEQCSKDGIVRGKQRYRCKSCGYRHTVTYKWYSESDKQRALAMYLEGLGFRSIGRLLGCSHVAVYQWIKQYGEKDRLNLPATEHEVVEMDEGHPSIGSKKTLVGCGLPLTIYQCGDRFTHNRNRAMPLGRCRSSHYC
jgi:transposase-like protein